MLNYLNPMGLLLKAQGYPPAVVFSIVLHVVVLVLMLDHDFAPDDMVDLDKPVYVSAVAVNENPQRKMRVLNEQREQAEREAQAERDRQRAEQQRIEEQRQQEAAAQAEAAREEAAREEAARRQRERDEQAERDRLAEQQRQEQARLDEERRQREQEEERLRQEAAAREEQARRAEEIAVAQQAAEADAMQGYIAIIHNAIRDNWILPPSARNGMTVVINLQLLPTGEIRSYNIVQSSGDAQFDRSAEQAVARVGRFPELQDMPTRLFNSQFRNINLTFRPEDLLR